MLRDPIWTSPLQKGAFANQVKNVLSDIWSDMQDEFYLYKRYRPTPALDSDVSLVLDTESDLRL